MDDEQRKKIAEAMDIATEEEAKEIADGIADLTMRLVDLGLVGEDNPAYPTVADAPDGSYVYAIQVKQPEERLYAWAIPNGDTIMATRMTPDGLEHSVLDSDGLPIEWRVAPKPGLN